MKRILTVLALTTAQALAFFPEMAQEAYYEPNGIGAVALLGITFLVSHVRNDRTACELKD